MSDNKIIKLDFPEVIRKRPGMYIESLVDPEVIVREVIDNAIDEVLISQTAKNILIRSKDGKYLVADDGRGIPIDYQPQFKMTSARLATSNLHAGSKFDNDTESVGMNGVGIKATNALSDKFILMSRITENNYSKSIPEVTKESIGKYYTIEYNRGNLISEGVIDNPNILDAFPEDLTVYNTIVYFEPDATMFDSVLCDLDTDRFRYVNLISDRRHNHKVNIDCNGVIYDDCDDRYKFSLSGEMDFFTDDEWEEIMNDPNNPNPILNKSMYYYVNFEFDYEVGGSLQGSVNTLAVNVGAHINILKARISHVIAREFNTDVLNMDSGLRMDVTVSMAEAIFGSQSKKRLTSIPGFNASDRVLGPLDKKIRNIVRSNKNYFQDHVDYIEKLNVAKENLSKNRLVKSTVKLADTKGFSQHVSDKLMDCTTTKRGEAELFITEGNSAGGTIAKIRDNSIHAILPLRGRPFNTVGMDIADVVKNQEILDIALSIGSGVNYNANIRRCRYGKIIVAADADPDGGVISSSILGFLADHMTYLINAGRVYLIESPLYKQNGKYIYPDDDIEKLLDRNKPYIRYKGLGEISSADAVDVFLNPETRRLVKVTLEGEEDALGLINPNVPDARRDLMRDIGVLVDKINV